MADNICRRNCLACNLQPTLEAKQMCASFKSVEMLSYLEIKIVNIEKEIEESKKKSDMDNSLSMSFNMDIITSDIQEELEETEEEIEDETLSVK